MRFTMVLLIAIGVYTAAMAALELWHRLRR